MATFREEAAHSVLTMCSLCILTIFTRFGFEGWIWVLIASVPGLCILFTFDIHGQFNFHSQLRSLSHENGL